jgi:N-acetylglucosaminyldiphosphoundecaprenol N-acetyl-beta-D-mannosaminyltransferase
MRQSYIVNADGQPFVFASKMLGGRGLKERCATTDLFHDVAEIASGKGITFFMLGASPDENSIAVENVKRTYPDLHVVGHHHGYLSSAAEEAAIVQQINDLKPDIVWVAMGFPRELDFCIRWRHALTNVGVMKTSGGLFNFLSGTNPRAPRWMQSAGLEWAYRLYLEPRRLFVRYATTNIVATWLLLTRTHKA